MTLNPFQLPYLREGDWPIRCPWGYAGADPSQPPSIARQQSGYHGLPVLTP